MLKTTYTGNAKEIVEACLPAIDIPFIRKEKLADYYLFEPVSVQVTKSMPQPPIHFSCVFWYIYWVINKQAVSWAIYMDEDQGDEGMVIRHIQWNISKDQSLIKDDRQILTRGEPVSYWPNLDFNIGYLSRENLLNITVQMDLLDKEIENGIQLSTAEQKRGSDITITHDHTSIMRQYPWGQLRGTWNLTKRNCKLEKHLDRIENILKTLLKKTCRVESILLDFSVLPEDQLNIITGERGS